MLCELFLLLYFSVSLVISTPHPHPGSGVKNILVLGFPSLSVHTWWPSWPGPLSTGINVEVSTVIGHWVSLLSCWPSRLLAWPSELTVGSLGTGRAYGQTGTLGRSSGAGGQARSPTGPMMAGCSLGMFVHLPPRGWSCLWLLSLPAVDDQRCPLCPLCLSLTLSLSQEIRRPQALFVPWAFLAIWWCLRNPSENNIKTYKITKENQLYRNAVLSNVGKPILIQ